MRKLDRIDRLILDILQREGRIAISELASRVNLSTTPCSERVKRLEREGIIMGYCKLLDKSATHSCSWSTTHSYSKSATQIKKNKLLFLRKDFLSVRPA